MATPAQDPAGAPAAYAPVAPPAALQAAFRSNLQITRDWLDDRDFASAAETADILILLAEAQQYQSSRPAWRQKTAELCESCKRLAEQCRARDAAGCRAAFERTVQLATDLAEQRDLGDRTNDATFRPGGSTRTVMKLLDGMYVDAKSARTPNDLALLSYALAEGANIARHLRTDPAWRDAATATRDAALETARRAPDIDLQEARAALKNVYKRCEACHQMYR